MTFPGILLLGIALSLDTFAISLSLGFAGSQTSRRQKNRFLLLIGVFHLLMIVVGWFFGENISKLVEQYDHWIAFILLAFLGVKMIREGWSTAGQSEPVNDLLCLKNTLLFCIALSIDALISGFSLGLVEVELIRANAFFNILLAGTLAGLCATAFSYIGMRIGSTAGGRLGARAEIFGGIILIIIGLKVLGDHML